MPKNGCINAFTIYTFSHFIQWTKCEPDQMSRCCIDVMNRRDIIFDFLWERDCHQSNGELFTNFARQRWILKDMLLVIPLEREDKSGGEREMDKCQ